jgi:hypothetical protein
MFVLGTVLIALAILFMLTALAMRAAGQLPHPILTAAVLVPTLAVGLAFVMN